LPGLRRLGPYGLLQELQGELLLFRVLADGRACHDSHHVEDLTLDFVSGRGWFPRVRIDTFRLPLGDEVTAAFIECLLKKLAEPEARSLDQLAVAYVGVV